MMEPEKRETATEHNETTVPPLIASAATSGSPPVFVPVNSSRVHPARQLLLFILSTCLGLFLMDGLFSVIDDSLVLFFGVHLLSGIRALVAFVALLVCVLVYLLIGITPAVPKRWFIPITLFFPVTQLLLVPVLIYAHGRMQEAEWAISLCELGIGLTVLFATRRKPLLKWPLIKEEWLKGRGFSWINLVGFILINCGLLIPLAISYLFFCGSLAVGHFSDGFVKLDTRGLTVQLRDYVRSDGKTIKLVPMSHVGDAGFYRELTQSFPSNSVVLLEGVSDEKNLLTNKITYKRMASSLGLAEQQKEFRPIGPKRVPADVDVEQFAGSTIDVLNMAMLVHSRGLNLETLRLLMDYRPPPNYEQQLFRDILEKRNEHLVDEIQLRLIEYDNLIVPWGAAHMPGIAREIQRAGFQLADKREIQAIRFGSRANRAGAKSLNGGSAQASESQSKQ